MADHRLTQQNIFDYAELTTDRNPLHVDSELASQSRFGGLIAHGFLLLGGPVSRVGETCDYPVTLRCSFVSPGRPGDVLVTDFNEKGEGSISFEVRTSGGEVRLTGSFGPAQPELSRRPDPRSQ